MHNAVAVGVNAGAHKLVARELAARVFVFECAHELGQCPQSLFVADIHAERGMPVVICGWCTLAGAGTRLARVDDEAEPEQCYHRDDERKNGAALEAHLLAFALLSELGDFFGG